ncbi:MAG: GAF domain-containing protein [Chloroflexota bacterium]
MDQNNLDEFHQRIADAAEAIRNEMDRLPNDQTALREQLNHLLVSVDQLRLAGEATEKSLTPDETKLGASDDELIRAENALRESEYQTLFNSMDQGYILVEMIFDENDVPIDILYVDANPAAIRMTGTELVGKTTRQLDPNYEQHWYEFFGGIAKTGIGQRLELSAEPLGVWYNVYAFKVGGADSRRVAAVYQDVTEHKRSEIAAQKAAVRDAFRVELSDALRTLSDPKIIQSEATRVLGQHLKATRVHYGEITDDGSFFVVQNNYTDGVENLIGRYPIGVVSSRLLEAAQTGEPLTVSDVHQDPRFSEKERAAYLHSDIGSQILVPLVKSGKLVAALSVHQKVPRLWTTEEMELIQETAERTWAAIAHARQTTQTQELAVLKDRQQLARELHDSVTQTLFSASVLSEVILRKWEQNQEGTPKLLSDLNSQIKGAMAEMRTLLLELRPGNVERARFIELLRQLVAAVQSRQTMQIDLEFEGDPILRPDVQLTVYRIVQESLNNIIKHSQAAQAWIVGRGGADVIEFRIRDNGVGFPVDEPSKGLGTQIMRERAKEIDARFEIRSTLGSGTEVYLLWPRTETPQFDSP